jgi:hypothetical protein
MEGGEELPKSTHRVCETCSNRSMIWRRGDSTVSSVSRGTRPC